MDYTIEIVAKDTLQQHRQLYRVVLKKMRLIFTTILCFAVLGYLILALESRTAADFFCLGISVLLLFMIWLMPELLGILSFRKKMSYYNGDLPDNVIQFGEELYI